MCRNKIADGECLLHTPSAIGLLWLYRATIALGYLLIFAQVSFNVTVRLNTSFSGEESLSAQK